MKDRLRTELARLGADLAAVRRMAILGEGNVSARIDDGAFLVKASGTNLSSLTGRDLVEVETAPLIAAVEGDSFIPDEEVESLLFASRRDAAALKPSVESLFHAWLLARPATNFVGHVHAIAVNQILCSPAAQQYAHKRLFPDHIVYCGAESVLVPYVDPGLKLARRIAAEVETYQLRTNMIPRTILLENHGIIAIGETAGEVYAALTMAEKAAEVFIGAAAMGGPVFMSGEHVRRIADRIDEHYRQRMLRQGVMGGGSDA